MWQGEEYPRPAVGSPTTLDVSPVIPPAHPTTPGLPVAGPSRSTRVYEITQEYAIEPLDYNPKVTSIFEKSEGAANRWSSAWRVYETPPCQWVTMTDLVFGQKDYCERVFMTPEALARHVLRDHVDHLTMTSDGEEQDAMQVKKFTTRKCAWASCMHKIFRSGELLREHVLRDHLSIYGFACPMTTCHRKNFIKTMDALETHVQTFHVHTDRLRPLIYPAPSAPWDRPRQALPNRIAAFQLHFDPIPVREKTPRSRRLRRSDHPALTGTGERRSSGRKNVAYPWDYVIQQMSEIEEPVIPLAIGHRDESVHEAYGSLPGVSAGNSTIFRKPIQVQALRRKDTQGRTYIDMTGLSKKNVAVTFPPSKATQRKQLSQIFASPSTDSSSKSASAQVQAQPFSVGSTQPTMLGSQQEYAIVIEDDDDKAEGDEVSSEGHAENHDRIEAEDSYDAEHNCIEPSALTFRGPSPRKRLKQSVSSQSLITPQQQVVPVQKLDPFLHETPMSSPRQPELQRQGQKQQQISRNTHDQLRLDSVQRQSSIQPQQHLSSPSEIMLAEQNGRLEFNYDDGNLPLHEHQQSSNVLASQDPHDHEKDCDPHQINKNATVQQDDSTTSEKMSNSDEYLLKWLSAYTGTVNTDFVVNASSKEACGTHT